MRKVYLKNNNRRKTVLSVDVDAITMNDALQQVEDWLSTDGSHYVATANAEMIMRAQYDYGLARALTEADMVLPDGAGVIWAGEQLRLHFPERVAGIDFMSALIERAKEKEYSFYFLGGKPDVAASAARNLHAKLGEIPLVGVRDGYFSDTETEEVLAEIRASGARLLFVGMGVPKQEYWLHEYIKKLPRVTAVGVGGSFDVLAGHLKRAPLWMQKNRLEWLYRLYLQPSRIKRMAVLPQFMWKVRRCRKKK